MPRHNWDRGRARPLAAPRRSSRPCRACRRPVEYRHTTSQFRCSTARLACRSRARAVSRRATRAAPMPPSGAPCPPASRNRSLSGFGSGSAKASDKGSGESQPTRGQRTASDREHIYENFRPMRGSLNARRTVREQPPPREQSPLVRWSVSWFGKATIGTSVAATFQSTRSPSLPSRRLALSHRRARRDYIQQPHNYARSDTITHLSPNAWLCGRRRSRRKLALLHWLHALPDAGAQSERESVTDSESEPEAESESDAERQDRATPDSSRWCWCSADGGTVAEGAEAASPSRHNDQQRQPGSTQAPAHAHQSTSATTTTTTTR